jgi:hypothetical protein
VAEGKNRAFLTYPSYNCPGGSWDRSAAASRPRLLRPRRAARPCICWDPSRTGAAGAVARPLLSTHRKERDDGLVSWQTIYRAAIQERPKRLRGFEAISSVKHKCGCDVSLFAHDKFWVHLGDRLKKKFR